MGAWVFIQRLSKDTMASLLLDHTKRRTAPLAQPGPLLGCLDLRRLVNRPLRHGRRRLAKQLPQPTARPGIPVGRAKRPPAGPVRGVSRRRGGPRLEVFLLLQRPLLLVLGLAPVLGPVGLVEAALLYLEPPGVDGGLVLVSRLLVVAKAAVYGVVEGPAERLADSLDNSQPGV